MTTHQLDKATCPQCDRTAKTFRRYGGRLICQDCYDTEWAKNRACTCTTTGHCEVCR